MLRIFLEQNFYEKKLAESLEVNRSPAGHSVNKHVNRVIIEFGAINGFHKKPVIKAIFRLDGCSRSIGSSCRAPVKKTPRSSVEYVTAIYSSNLRKI